MRKKPEELAAHARSLAETLGSVKFDPNRMGGLCRQLCDTYRALGISIFLRDADLDALFHWLIQSSLVRRHFLSACASQGGPGPVERKTSRVGPFLDAVAANQWGLARAIARLSPAAHRDDAEYEDDFAYAHALHLLAAEAPDEGALTSTLDRFEAVLEGAPSARLDVARALLLRDQESFDEAFDRLLDLREAELAKVEGSALGVDPTFPPNQRLFVEGLAILRLAGARGLVTAPEYRTCPALARAAACAPFRPLAFPGVGLDGL